MISESVGKLAGYPNSKQLLLQFSATPGGLAAANHNFAKSYVETVEKSLEKGYLVLPDDLNYFDFAESTGKMNKPVILLSAEIKLGLRQMWEMNME